MKRSRVWEIFKTVILVTAITLLIWLWAEGENVRPYRLNGEIAFAASHGKALILRPLQPDQNVQITIRSNVNKREEAQRMLAAGPLEIDVTDDPDQPKVTRTIDLLDRLRNRPEFLNSGITITEVRPQTMAVEVERLETITLPIRVETGDVALASPASVDVTEANIQVPAGMADALADMHLIARPDPQRLARLNVNEPHTFGPVSLMLPETFTERDKVLAIEPASVRVTLTVRSQTDRLTLERVPVMTVMPPAEVGRFRINLDDRQRVLPDIEITGPTEVINRIRNKELNIEAVLRFSADDLETNADRESVTWPVYIDTPPEVTVLTPPARMTFKIIKLQTTSEGITETLPAAALP